MDRITGWHFLKKVLFHISEFHIGPFMLVCYSCPDEAIENSSPLRRSKLYR